MWYSDSSSSFPSVQQTPALLCRIAPQRRVHKRCRPVLSGATTTIILRQMSGRSPGGYQRTLTTRFGGVISGGNISRRSEQDSPEIVGVDAAIGAVTTWRRPPTNGGIATHQASQFLLLLFSGLTTLLTVPHGQTPSSGSQTASPYTQRGK
jgi:hypothetical protein